MGTASREEGLYAIAPLTNFLVKDFLILAVLANSRALLNLIQKSLYEAPVPQSLGCLIIYVESLTFMHIGTFLTAEISYHSNAHFKSSLPSLTYPLLSELKENSLLLAVTTVIYQGNQFHGVELEPVQSEDIRYSIDKTRARDKRLTALKILNNYVHSQHASLVNIEAIPIHGRRKLCGEIPLTVKTYATTP